MSAMTADANAFKLPPICALDLEPSVQTETETETNANVKITLNIGGRRFDTTRATLAPSAMLSATLTDGKHDAGEELFVDRSPELFAIVLEFMRNGCRFVDAADGWPRSFSRRALALEMDYFGIELGGEASNTLRVRQTQSNSKSGTRFCHVTPFIARMCRITHTINQTARAVEILSRFEGAEIGATCRVWPNGVELIDEGSGWSMWSMAEECMFSWTTPEGGDPKCDCSFKERKAGCCMCVKRAKTRAMSNIEGKVVGTLVASGWVFAGKVVGNQGIYVKEYFE
jgi:hypothetical protein